VKGTRDLVFESLAAQRPSPVYRVSNFAEHLRIELRMEQRPIRALSRLIREAEPRVLLVL
jgi:hypothetical protein